MTETIRLLVTDGPVGIRVTPNGEKTGKSLQQGEEIVVLDRAEAGGYVWVQHARGWSAKRNSDGNDVYMTDISNRDPNAPRTFRVWNSFISIRQSPNGKLIPQKLYRNTNVIVEGNSRTEAGKYIWWKHDLGWSAERSINGNEVLMKEVFETPQEQLAKLPAELKVKLPSHWQGKMPMQVAQMVKARSKPSTDKSVTIIKNIARGSTIHCDMDTIVEAEGYYWVHHNLGWSAINSVDGKTVFLGEPGTIPGLVYIDEENPQIDKLPYYRQLITRQPVNVADTGWFQYYGNNMFAIKKGKDFGYDRYSQGLHGGLDYGNSKRPVPVYLGTSAKYVRTEFFSANNTRMIFEVDDYTLIYQHLTNTRSFFPGQVVAPDVQIADVEHKGVVAGGLDHLHFEVRYMKEWIINPLWLYTDTLYQELTKTFDPAKPNTTYARDFPKSKMNCFYVTDTWTKWATPLDQPVIKLNGAVKGPKADLPREQW